MHPTVLTIIADDRARQLRAPAERRGRVIRSPRRWFALRLPSRGVLTARTGS